MKSIHIFVFILLALSYCCVIPAKTQPQMLESTTVPIADIKQIPLTLKLPYGEVLVFAPNGEKQTTVTKYDAQLKPVWSKAHPFHYSIALEPNGFSGDNLYFYYQRTDSLLRVVSMNLMTGDLTPINCLNPLQESFEVGHFEALPKALLFAKKKNQSNSVLHFDIERRKAKILPNTNFIKADFVEMKADQATNTLGLIMKQSDAYFFNFYDAKGEMIFDSKIYEEDSKHKFISHHTVIKNANEQYVIGLFGANRLIPQGIYISNFVNHQYKGTKYYRFHQLKNFHKHLPEKEQDKIREEIGKKGKHKYKYFLKQELLKEIDGQIVYAIDIYKNGSSTKNSHRVMLFCGLDKDGKLMWDNAFNYQNLKEKDFFFEVKIRDAYALSRRIAFPLFSMSFGLKNTELSVTNLTFSKFFFAKTSNKEYFKDTEIALSPFPLISQELNTSQITHWYEDNFLLIGVVKDDNRLELKLIKVR